MSATTYHTIQLETEGLYKEKGSKFLSFAFPVASQEDIKLRLNELRKSYYDARHFCYAWVLGLSNQNWRANDDGEPAHSAGDPILGQIRSSDLTNVLVVVVRYFGGTKLGVGGLIGAYKQAAGDALAKVQRSEVFEQVALRFSFPYDLLSTMERLIVDFELDVSIRDFRESCRIEAKIRKEWLAPFQIKVKDLYTLQVTMDQD